MEKTKNKFSVWQVKENGKVRFLGEEQAVALGNVVARTDIHVQNTIRLSSGYTAYSIQHLRLCHIKKGCSIIIHVARNLTRFH